MTGEMYSINAKGEDSNGDVWRTHAVVARAVKGTLKPFDVYQGPYIVVGQDIRAGCAPYAMPVRGLGVIRLWLNTEDGVIGTIWREDTETESDPFWCEDTRAACREARKILAA